MRQSCFNLNVRKYPGSAASPALPSFPRAQSQVEAALTRQLPHISTSLGLDSDTATWYEARTVVQRSLLQISSRFRSLIKGCS